MKKTRFLVTFEGIEGSGKTTQFNWFVRKLKKSGLSVLALREPGSTGVGEEIRNILLHSRSKISPLTEALLFCAARVQMIREKIRDSKADIIILDRFFDSTLSYQGSSRELGINYKDFERLVINLSLGVTPDLTFICDVSPSVSLRRKKDKDRFFKKKMQFHRTVRSFYKKLSRRFPGRIAVINSARPKEEVSCDLWKVFLKRCPKKFLTYIR